MTDEPLRTLGDYRKFAVLLRSPTAIKFFDDKIAKQGADEPVLADSNQMLMLMASFLEQDK